ncbi:glycosyl hydrolase family 8 [Companilactobacillus huachuanensis]|uniref:Glucanase n=1 Tax=Companilactobacillus huachuanensis TaxID=2559914 RepID=A0ABW1RMT8_9LACO|nr:glycosyl hydrolase family 8 [Companilactobacillus huachuanensis]
MRHHKYQWLISGLIILVAFAIGIAVYNTYSPRSTSNVSTTVVKEHYQTWTKAYLRGNKQQKFVKTNKGTKDQTLSEAQGYGMLITVMAAQQGFGSQKTFNQLTRYYMRHEISSQNPLMAWRQNHKGIAMVSTKAEKTSATDGDLDIAYALILADERWGSKGELKYNQLAKRLLSAIKSKEINSTTKLPKVGDWATGPKSATVVRTSDLMTAYFRKFASYTNDGSWTKVAQNSQILLKKLSNQQGTGLMADFVTVRSSQLKTGTIGSKEVASEHDNQYGFNACRIPWRVAYDYQLYHSQTSKQIVRKMCRFFADQKQITAIYTLSGKPVESYSNAAFTTPIVYAAQVVGNPELKSRYIQVLTGKMSKTEYYPATIQMATLLASSNIGK